MKAYYVADTFLNAEGIVDLVNVIQGDVHQYRSVYPETALVVSQWKLTNTLSILVQQELRSFTVFAERTYWEFGEHKTTCQKVMQGIYESLLEKMFALKKGDIFVVQKQDLIVVQPTLENLFTYGPSEAKIPVLDAIFSAAQRMCAR